MLRLGGAIESLRPGRRGYGGDRNPIRLPRPQGIDRVVSVRTGREGIEYDDIPAAREAFETYPNLADNPEVADRALRTVQRERQDFRTKTADAEKKWKVHMALYRGRGHLGRSHHDVHVPSFYEVVQRYRARINKPWEDQAVGFDLEGVDVDDRRRVQKLRAFLAHQLRQNRIDEIDRDADIPALMTGFAVAKVYPTYETGIRIKRTPMGVDIATGERRMHVEDEHAVLFQGNRISLCDSLSVCIDPNRLDPNHPDPSRRSRFIMDSSSHVYERLLERQRQGQIVNVEQLQGKQGERSTMTRRSNSFMDGMTLQSDPGSAQEHIVTERWGLFRPYDGAPAEEFVIEIADDQTVLRVQRNPLRRQLRPYAVWKCNPEPFEALSMTPMDHVVLLNIQQDRLFRLFMRASEFQAVPAYIARQHTDFPSSLMGLTPGKILFGDPDAITPLAVNVKTQDLLRGMEVCAQHIEESTGAYSLPGDTSGTDTATEIDTKRQEANERISDLQDSKAKFKADIITLAHEINRQYITEEQTFRVLGRDAADLPGYGIIENISPEEMDVDVDVVFHGLARKKLIGLESQRLQAFGGLLANYAQLDPELPRKFDLAKLLKDGAYSVLGYTPGDEIVDSSSDTPPMHPHMENVLLQSGKTIAIHDEDDHDAHIEAHMELVDRIEDKTPEDEVERIMQHVFAHVAAAEQAEVASSQPSPDQVGAVSAPGQGSAPVREPVASQSPQGVTPGPPNVARQRLVGRKMTPNQTMGA